MYIIGKGYDFDDLLLVPRGSIINSRSDVDLSVELSSYLKLDFPIIASPMEGIISTELIIKLSYLGGIGILHRFYNSFFERIKDIRVLSKECKDSNFGVAVGLDRMDRVWTALDYGAKIVCIDVANGYLSSILKFTEKVSKLISVNHYDTLVMSGNITDGIGLFNLSSSGADLIRVGIGSGGLCSTRNVTGVGIPQLTAIDNCVVAKGVNEIDSIIIADGGIRNSGDAVKALAVGAGLVMIGSLFGSVHESANDNGTIYGMAGRRIQDIYYDTTKSVEGIEKVLEKTRSLEDFISEFTWNMRSALTYLQSRNLSDLVRNAEFIETGKGSIKNIG